MLDKRMGVDYEYNRFVCVALWAAEKTPWIRTAEMTDPLHDGIRWLPDGTAAGPSGPQPRRTEDWYGHTSPWSFAAADDDDFEDDEEEEEEEDFDDEEEDDLDEEEDFDDEDLEELDEGIEDFEDVDEDEDLEEEFDDEDEEEDLETPGDEEKEADFEEEEELEGEV